MLDCAMVGRLPGASRGDEMSRADEMSADEAATTADRHYPIAIGPAPASNPETRVRIGSRSWRIDSEVCSGP